MKIKKKDSPLLEADLTPMIDVTFQLIAFFMVLINFTDAEQNETIKLPDSVLAKPPETTPDYAITLHMTNKQTFILRGEEYLLREAKQAVDLPLREAVALGHNRAEVTIIIRADKNAKHGEVQELIRGCQQAGGEQFTLRVKERHGTSMD